MALWNNIGRRVSVTTSKAMRQAQVLSETAKLNALISEEEKKINQIYFQLGKYYVENHREVHDEDLSEFFSMLFSHEENISRYRDQVQIIKGIIKCSNCGTQVNSSASFCSACGTAIPKLIEIEEDSEEEELMCANCGSVIDEGMHFCTNCGHPIEIEMDDFDKAIYKEVEAPIEYRCENCGALMDEGDTFCIECGAGL